MADYSNERYNPSLAYCKGSIRLDFDGNKLTMYGGANLPYTYPAVSGRPTGPGGFDYSSERQRISKAGPIPAGIYWIRPDELWGNAWYHVTASRSAWGNFRISIHPFTTTETFGRGGFFIHGGDTPGRAGCIDLSLSMDKFVSDLRREVGENRTCKIHLSVTYQ